MTDERDELEEQAWREHATAQRRAWLALTYAQRLAWLEDAKRFVALAHGAARHKRGSVGEPQGGDSAGE